MSISREYMERKLREWNPHWNPSTIEGWNTKQLTEIYKKETAKTVSFIYAQLGLSN